MTAKFSYKDLNKFEFASKSYCQWNPCFLIPLRFTIIISDKQSMKERVIFTLHEKATWPAALFNNTCDSLFENNTTTNDK